MRRFLILLLTAVLVCTVSVSAFADSETLTGLGKREYIITGDFIKASRVDEYHVDITWTGVSYTYNWKTGTWDLISYLEVDAGNWKKTESTVTVTNRSSLSLTATFDATLSQDVTDFTLSFGENSTLSLAGGPDAAMEDRTGSVELSLGGKLTQPESKKLGLIIITLE